MIAVSSSSRSFATLGRYLVVGRDKVEEGRVAWTSARNLPTNDPELAAKIMRATASQNVRVSQPVYHLALSFDPRDVVDRAAMERVADRVLAALKLQEYQAIIVAHEDRAHPHMHILINRVHPETGRAWDRWQDYPALQRALREEERALGLRAVEGHLGESRDRESKVTRRDSESTRVPSELEHARPARRRGEEGDILAVKADLETHERVSELSQQRFTAERDVAACQARLDRLEIALERVARSEAALDGALSKVYRDPAEAKAAFLLAAEQCGAKEAACRMRETPEVFGQLVSTNQRGGFIGRSDETRAPAREAAREAAAYGAELSTVRREVASLVEPQRGRASGVALLPTEETAAARESVRGALDSTRNYLLTLREAEKAMPAREQLEFRLAQGLRRLSPPEFEKLRLTLSPYRITLAHKLRHMVRDAALGRDDEQ